MTVLDQLLLLSAAATGIGFWLGRARFTGWLLTAVYGVQLALLFASAPPAGTAIPSALGFNVLGFELHWALDGLGWFFAVITVGAALFSSWYASGDWGRQEPKIALVHGTLALNVLAMLVLLSSGELLGLFIGWELVSWSGFLMMAFAGRKAMAAAVRYLVYAMGGAMALLAALVLVANAAGSLAFGAAAEAVAAMGTGEVWVVLLLFFAGFSVKMALLPFHLWQAEAYSETPGPGAAFLGAISSRMGLFALVLVLAKVIGFERLNELAIPFTFLDGMDLLAWIAAFTLIIPTYVALTQSDARMLLAWHGIGQGGYMLLGLIIATDMGAAGGLLHVFNYATYQAALFLAVTAVIYRTGTSDLDRLGGLITRMPLTYVVMLMGIIGLAGLPPMNGFVSKWLIYKGLLEDGRPLLFVAAIIGTLGTILSVYKLIHNTFLGQLRAEHRAVREAPWSMTVPMLALAGIGFVTGWMPGLALELVDYAQGALGIALLPHHLGGVTLPNGSLDMLWVVGALLACIGVGALVFFLGNRRHVTHQLDNYAGGHFLTAEHRYQYSHNFYAGLMHLIGPWYRGSFQKLENALAAAADVGGAAATGIYRHGAMVLYAIAAAAIGVWMLV